MMMTRSSRPVTNRRRHQFCDDLMALVPLSPALQGYYFIGYCNFPQGKQL